MRRASNGRCALRKISAPISMLVSLGLDTFNSDPVGGRAEDRRLQAHRRPARNTWKIPHSLFSKAATISRHWRKHRQHLKILPGKLVNKSVYESVTKQFSPRAPAYVQSAVHAHGEDLIDLQTSSAKQFAHALDLGCGGGHVSFALAPHVGKIIAYDLRRKCAAVAQQAASRELANLKTQRGAAEKLPFDDACFVSSPPLQCPSLARYPCRLREARRVLKSGGRAMFMDVVAPTIHCSIPICRPSKCCATPAMCAIIPPADGHKCSTTQAFRPHNRPFAGTPRFRHLVARMRTRARRATASAPCRKT